MPRPAIELARGGFIADSEFNGSTIVNGINDKHQLVGFWGIPPLNTGFLANPQ